MQCHWCSYFSDIHKSMFMEELTNLLHLKVWSKLKPKSYLYITKWEHKTNIEWSKRGYFFTALLMNLKLVGHVGVLLSIKIARSAHRKSNSGFELPILQCSDIEWSTVVEFSTNANATFSSIIATLGSQSTTFTVIDKIINHLWIRCRIG